MRTRRCEKSREESRREERRTKKKKLFTVKARLKKLKAK